MNVIKMMNEKIVRFVKQVLIGWGIFGLIGCGGYGIIQKQVVPDIPKSAYTRIIKLDNPEGQPDRTLAGVVHVTGRATVCTDYPREETIKNLAELSVMEKNAFSYYQHYVIQDGAQTLGYVSLPIGYQAIIWHKDKDPQCQYKVQIILPSPGWRRGVQDGADKSILSW